MHASGARARRGDDVLPMQRRRRRQRSWLPTGGGAVGPLLLCCALGTSAPSSPWLGVAAAHAASRAPIIPRVGAPSSILSSSVSILSSSSSSSSGLACFVGAARRSPSINHQRRGDRGGGRTVCWDSERGEGPAAGSSRSSGSGRRVKDFAPFKAGSTLARLVRPGATSATTSTIPPPAPTAAAAAPPTTTAAYQPAPSDGGGVGAGLQRIWDAVQGRNVNVGGSGDGGGSNAVFKVLLATVACVYGTNFGAIKYLDEANVDVSIVTAIRFALASGALAPFLLRAPRHILVRGLEVGVWVAFGYLTQAIGLQDTQASKSAFICSLSVVVVPIVNAIVYKKRPPPTTWLASILAVIGVGMLTLEGDLTPSAGDLWSLGQPLGFGVAFVRTEQCMSQNKDQALAMTAAQMLGVFMCAFVWVFMTLTTRAPDLTALWNPANVAALVYTGVVTSALAVVAESVALAHVSAEETTVILSTEPLWAALFGAAVLGEKLDGLGYLGGLVIVAGCVLTQAKLPRAWQSRLEAVFGPAGKDEIEGE